MKKLCWILITGLYIISLSNVSAKGSAPPSEVPGLPIDRARQHSQNVYRGARPEVEGTLAIKQFGIQNIVNLEDDEKEIARERKQAAGLGLNFISSPMNF